MTAATLTYNIPALSSPMDAGKINSTTPTVGMFANGWTPDVDVIKAEEQNWLHNASTSYLWLVQALGLAMPFNPASGASVVATPAGGIVTIKNNSTGATEFYVALNNMSVGYTDPSLDPTNWALIDFQKLAKYPPAFGTGGGTADAITSSITTPYPALTNGMQFTVDITTVNATTMPTFQPTLVNTNQSNTQTARTIVKYSGLTKVPVSIGDVQGRCVFTYDSSGTPQYILMNPATGRGGDFFSVSASASAGALTTGFAAGQLIKFRSSTLTDGVPVALFNAAALSAVIPSGATLGSVSGATTIIYKAVVNDGGTLRLALINAISSTALDEDELITTSAISGSSNTAGTWYSTVAITNPSAYRIVGFCEAVNTSGSWASPTVVQPGGGLAISMTTQIGISQTWQSVTRTSGTTYYNTTGRPIMLQGDAASTANTVNAIVTISIDGGTAFNFIHATETASGGTPSATATIIIPVGASYVLTDSGIASRTCHELR